MDAPLGYTSVLPESASSAEDSVYAMASAMEKHQGSFNDDKSAEVKLSSSPYFRVRRPRSQALSQYTSGPFTSAVSESSPTSDASANNWASNVFMRHGGTEQKAQTSPAVQLHSDVKAREQQLSSYGQVSDTSGVHYGQSAAVREGPAMHDQRAWGWAVEALQHHRDQVQRAKFTNKLAPRAQAPAMAAAPAYPAQLDTKLQRMYKLRAARAAMMDVHRTTQQGESHDFAQDQHKAQLREQEVGPATLSAPAVCNRALFEIDGDSR